MPSISSLNMLNRQRTQSRGSTSSAGSFSSGRSAASGMSEDEVDNFRSMRGKGGNTTEDLSQHMTDDASDLFDRLHDVAHSRELEKKLFDTTGQAYTILITTTDVRLMHVDDKGHYHFNHFNSRKTYPGNSSSVKQRWRIVDDDETDHTFVAVSPSWVTVHHSAGTWQCRRIKGRVYEIEDSDRSRPISKRIPRPVGPAKMAGKRAQRTWRLYVDVDDSDRSSNATPQEALLCANTPGEKGQRPRAHQSFYHDVKN